MHRFSAAALFLTSLALVNLAGCPLDDILDNGSGNTTTPTTMKGSWSGVLTSTSTKTTDGVAGTPLPGTRSLTLVFNSNYVAAGLPIWGFDKAFDQTTVKTAVDESETFEYEANTPYREIVLKSTVREATYGETSALVVLDLTYDSANNTLGLVETGTGTMVIDAKITGATMTVTATATYTVEQTANNVTVTTSETIVSTGTLTK